MQLRNNVDIVLFNFYFQENVGPQVVDGVLEDIRLGMEVSICIVS